MEALTETAIASVDVEPAAGALAPDSLGDLVGAVVTVDEMIAGLMAMRAELMDQARVWAGVADRAGRRAAPRSTDLAARSLRAEFGTALRLSERTVENLLGVAEVLVHRLPITLGALRAGSITYRHSQLITDHVGALDGDALVDFERQAVAWAKVLTPAKLDRKLRVLRARIDPQPLEVRHARAAAERELRCDPGQDGMAWLTAHLRAPDALAIFNRVTDTAASLRGQGEERTLAQLRVDVFRDVLLDDVLLDDDARTHVAADVGVEADADADADARADAHAHADADADADAAGRARVRARFRGIRPSVIVTVPVLSLLGLSTVPADLDGYGPIDADTARELAGRASSFLRILTHPETGAVLSVGRDRYAVPADLRTWLQVRDRTCRFPGCSRAAVRCDVDHTGDWAFGGHTGHDNLAHLCRAHHTLKHNTAWRVAQARDGTGVLHWTSPIGRGHTTEPETVIASGLRDIPPPPF